MAAPRGEAHESFNTTTRHTVRTTIAPTCEPDSGSLYVTIDRFPYEDPNSFAIYNQKPNSLCNISKKAITFLFASLESISLE
jgi:hypothetical protein